ncbi:MAG: CIA30 family protein [Deltaproteobacteria bacterium]|nr:CIA30 family protein [Deltaproteobacteria bacterium]
MKSLIAVVFVFSALFSLPAVADKKKLHIDSFKDGNHISQQGGWWYVYDDARLGGNTEVTPLGVLNPTKGNDAQGYAAHVEGTVGNKLGWDYFGFGVTLKSDSGCPAMKKVDLSKYTTLEFKIKGDASGGRLTVALLYSGETCDGNVPKTLTHWADYEASVTADLTGKWTTVRLNLRNDFAQPYWAKPEDKVCIEKVLKSLSVLQWHFSSPDGDSLNVWIDDIYFY